MSSHGFTKTILIVDDDADIREVLTELLRCEGHSVFPTGNGLEALETVKSLKKTHLIFLDMMMPIMDGRTFLDKLCGQPSICSIPVVVLSASASPRDAHGARAFIKKPVDLPVILECVELYSLP